MKRIDLHYGGHLYSVGGREVDELQQEITARLDTGGWLVVNDGEGARRDSYLWIAPGVPIALIPIPEDPAT